MLHKNSLCAIVLLIAVCVVSSCRKKDKDKPDTDVQAADDNALMEGTSADLTSISEFAIAGVNSFRTSDAMNIMAPCGTVTRDTLVPSDPDTIVIDFGPTNCLCQDNRNRRGKLQIVHQGHYFLAGSFRTITFDNYHVNDRKIEGTHTVTANGNSSGNYTWTINAQGMKVTRPDGNYITWDSQRTRTMISGANTPFIGADDIYEITGSGSGVNINGIPFTAIITEALRKAVNCNWIEKGKITISPQGFADRLLDYGTSGCDNIATVTIGSYT